jgi:hypothetical protein
MGGRLDGGHIAMRTLRDTLLSSETALPLLLFIARIQSQILFSTATPDLKLISHLYDTAQDVLMQFTEFLVAGAKSIEDIAKIMPPMAVLLGEIGLAVPVAFQLVRPILRAALLKSKFLNPIPKVKHMKLITTSSMNATITANDFD